MAQAFPPSPNPRGLLLLLLGLPGSGKTHLANWIEEHGDRRQLGRIVRLTFDDLVPHAAQSKLIEEEEGTGMRRVRDTLRRAVMTAFDWSFKGKEEEDEIFWGVLGRFEFLKDSKEEEMVTVILDDNYYYRSMRYAYYQVAREQRMSFVQVFVKAPEREGMTSLDVLREINASRPCTEQLDVRIIENMSRRFEEPDMLSHPWESSSLSFQRGMSSEDNLLELITLLAKHVVPPPLDLEAVELAKEKDREVTRDSLLQRADLALRKHVRERLTEAAREPPKAKESQLTVKEMSVCLTTEKSKLLEVIRRGEMELAEGGEEKLCELLDAALTKRLRDRPH